MNIEWLVTGPLSTNTYIVYENAASGCIVVDPAAAQPVIDFLESNSLSLTHILVTHEHFDHILGVAELKEKYGAKICIGEYAAKGLSSSKYNLSAFVGTSVRPSEADVTLTDGQRISLAGIEILCLSTPGHSRGGMCYILENERVIFCGDTLFRLSVGRTDLYGCSKQDLLDSILYKLYSLKGDYRLLAGHEEESTLEYERHYNPFTRGQCL